jgi:hypothetical protein
VIRAVLAGIFCGCLVGGALSIVSGAIQGQRPRVGVCQLEWGDVVLIWSGPLPYFWAIHPEGKAWAARQQGLN